MTETTEVNDLPQPGELWRHHKGGLYRVVCLALVEATGQEVVVYAAATGEPPCWTRPLAQWGQLLTVKTDDGGTAQVRRFARAEPLEVEDTQPAGPTIEQRGRGI